MKKPTMPPLDYNKEPDYHQITFKYIPQLLKFYALKGMSLEKIKKQFDFQEALFLGALKNEPKLLDAWVNSWWGKLIYLWIYQDDMMPRLIEFVKNTPDDKWWKDNREPNEEIQKNITDHMTDLFGKEMSQRIIKSIAHDLADGRNNLVGIEYMEMCVCSHYHERYKGFDKYSERERVLNYLILLDKIFKNYQLSLEESYLEESEYFNSTTFSE